MEKTIFAKKRTSNDGKTFYNYFTKLTKKDGTEVVVQVKFRDECGSPVGANCPMNITFNKKDANYTEKEETYTDSKTQEEKVTTRRIMWVSAWTEGTPYVDTSMDEFED